MVKGPLSGVMVVNVSRILAGPYCTLLMAELGARVIKVEPPEKGDDAREYGPFLEGKSAYFMSINRGKQSIALNLKGAADKRIFERLLERGDVLVENFRPGTMEKLGYGWEELHRRYPRLIYAAASGFGHSGPFSHYPAYDMVVQGLGGIMSITGHPGQPPVRIGMSIGDIGAGLYAAVAVNAALLHRERTGEATKVDIAMFDCQLALLENAILRYTTSGQVPGPMGARHPSITPFQAFATADGYMIIAAGNDGLYRKLCDALARPELASDPRFLTNDLRTRNGDELRDAHRAAPAQQADRGLDQAPRCRRRPLRPDQQRGPGACPSPGRGAQHARRARRPQGRARAPRRQPDEDRAPLRTRAPAIPHPISMPTAPPS